MHENTIDYSKMSYELHINMSEAYRKCKMYEESINSYQAAIRINPDDNLAYFNLGSIFFQMKKFQLAL